MCVYPLLFVKCPARLSRFPFGDKCSLCRSFVRMWGLPTRWLHRKECQQKSVESVLDVVCSTSLSEVLLFNSASLTHV